MDHQKNSNQQGPIELSGCFDDESNPNGVLAGVQRLIEISRGNTQRFPDQTYLTGTDGPVCFGN